MMWCIELLLLLSFLLYLLHLYISKDFDYWKKKNVPFLKPKPFVGNMMGMLLQKYEMSKFFEMLYKKMDVPFFGLFVFSKPALIVKDLNHIKHILVKDFDHFVDRNIYAPEFEPAMAHMLFVEKGEEWKVMRAKMRLFFVPSKVKFMFSAVDDLAQRLCSHILEKKKRNTIDAKEVSSKYTVGVITQCVFGVDSKSLENEDAEFMKIANKVFDTRPITCFRYLCYFFFHSFVRIFRMRIFDSEVTCFMRKVFWECIIAREENNIRGNDLIDIIVELRKNKEFCEKWNFDGDKVTAQALIFFAAGYETTGTTISLTLHALCMNQDVQQKLRSNIKECMAKHNGKVTLEAVEEISYLDLVIKETLRLYPPAPIIDRVCTADYKIPGTDVVIDKGTIILMPALGIQKDPKYFTNPEEFIPERFNSDMDEFTNLPFGHGPRNCIGIRFGLLMVKLAIVRILQEFEVHPTDETPVSIVFSPRSVIPQPSEKLIMKFVKVDPLF